MPPLRKITLIQSGLFILSLFFVFQGLIHLFDHKKRGKDLETKLYNLDTIFENNNIPFFSLHFLHSSPIVCQLLILSFGLANLTSGCLILFFEERKKRNIFLQVLFITQMFKAFVIHNPVTSSTPEGNSKEWKDCILSFMIGVSLFMMAGYRTVKR